MMPHSFTPRLGLDLKRACRDRGCTLQDLVNDALELYLREDVSTKPAAQKVASTTEPYPIVKGTWREGGQAYDVYNEKTGGIDRFDRNGKNISHLKPAEYVNGIQYYRDTMGSNPNTKWYKNEQGDWVGVVRV